MCEIARSTNRAPTGRGARGDWAVRRCFWRTSDGVDANPQSRAGGGAASPGVQVARRSLQLTRPRFWLECGCSTGRWSARSSCTSRSASGSTPNLDVSRSHREDRSRPEARIQRAVFDSGPYGRDIHTTAACQHISATRTCALHLVSDRRGVCATLKR